MSQEIPADVAMYRTCLQSIVLCGQMLHQFNLPNLLQAISQADVMGPILDPTLWNQKQKAMHEDRLLIQAALPLWKFVNEKMK